MNLPFKVFFFHYKRYFWTKDSKAFDWILFNDRMTQRAGSGTLVIKSPRDEDVGKHSQCPAACLKKFYFKLKYTAFLPFLELNAVH